MENVGARRQKPDPAVSISLLGRLTIRLGAATAQLPPSRKLQLLLAYLALAPREVGRSQLCDLLWHGPNDPRGELRWCLSRLRRALGEHAGVLRTTADTVGLDRETCEVDALRVEVAAAQGFESLDPTQLRALDALFEGEILEGLTADRSPAAELWLAAQRRRFNTLHLALLDAAIRQLPEGSGDLVPLLERRLQLAPDDAGTHVALLRSLSGRGDNAAGDAHFAIARRHFETERLDFATVRDAWHRMRRPPASFQSCGAPPSSPGDRSAASEAGTARARLAVMPFTGASVPASPWLAEGLTYDIITRLAKLRSLFVIARGSVVTLARRGMSPQEAGRALAVGYVASGEIRAAGQRLRISVELVEVASSRVVWSETLEAPAEGTFELIEAIGSRIVSSLSHEIEAAESRRAVLKAPNSLNAWEAYHRGLWHMYRFTRADNDEAQRFFALATDLDPTFSRAHAGLSFTHWQRAFQHWGDRDAETRAAHAAAVQSLLVDDQDPAAQWAMGRALWLADASPGRSLAAMQKAVDLSPHFALGHYALAFVHSQSGDPGLAIEAADQSRLLSPFDPLLFGMLGSRAMARARLGRFEEAADDAVEAAAQHNAHIAIHAIAAHCLELAGRHQEAVLLAGQIRLGRPGYSTEDFLRTFRFDERISTLFRRAGRALHL